MSTRKTTNTQLKSAERIGAIYIVRCNMDITFDSIKDYVKNEFDVDDMQLDAKLKFSKSF